MSSPLKQNTTTIQELLDTINALPTAENLDTELSAQTTLLSEQDAKIAELAQVLAGKAGGGSGGSGSVETCTVTIVNELTDELYGMEDFIPSNCFLDIYDEEKKHLVIEFTGSVTPSNPKTLTVSNVICGSSLIAFCSTFVNSREITVIVDGNANVASCLHRIGTSIDEFCPRYVCYVDILSDCTITLMPSA